jgi:hypothetical protein
MSLAHRLIRLEQQHGQQFAVVEQQENESAAEAQQRAETLRARHPGMLHALVVLHRVAEVARVFA